MKGIYSFLSLQIGFTSTASTDSLLLSATRSRSLKKFLIVLIVLIAEVKAIGQTTDYLSKVKVYVAPNSQERLQAISLLELDHFKDKPGYIEAEVGQKEMQALRQSGIRYEILSENTIAEVAELNRAFNEQRRLGLVNDDGTPRSLFDLARAPFEQPGTTVSNIINTPAGFRVYNENFGYYSLSRIDSMISAVFTAYSPLGLVDTFHLGTTVGGNIIKAIKISDNVNTDEATEPDCFFQGLQHAREAIGGSSMIFFMLYLLENYNTDIRIQNLVNNREIYIIICMNPDGWNHNLVNLAGSTGGTWRKNRRNNGDATFGVDLNRNWSTGWNNCPIPAGSCGSTTTSSDIYVGTGAFSENETQAVRNFIKSKRIVVANDQHSYGPYFSLPFGRPALHTATPGGDANLEDDAMNAEELNWYVAIPALMGKYNGMRSGNSFQALNYEVAGGVKDWMFRGEIGTTIGTGQKFAIKSMTGEGGLRVSGRTSSSASNFWPASNQIITLCKAMTYQNLQMVYSAGSFVDIQDMTPIDLPSTSGNFTFRIKRLGLDNQPVTVSVVPVLNVGAVGVPVIVNSLPNYYDTHTANISYNLHGSITPGQIVKFAWKVETTGYSYSDTITKFYSPTVLLSDNMEGSLTSNWTNETEGNSVTSGFASPYDYTYAQGDWQFTSGGFGGSGNALSESANGTRYPQTSIRIIRHTNPFNLTSATAAYLSFYTRHALDNFKDKVQVQVARSLSGPWTAIEGKTTVKEPGTPDIADESTLNGQPALTGIQPDWVQEEFNFSAYLGAGNSQVYFRFVFASDQTETFWAAEDEGIFIDNVKFIVSTTPLVTLAANFLSLNGKLNADNTIGLKWEATTDNDHSYFEVEKSANGNNFQSIGRVTGTSSPYAFTDLAPLVGNNFYRIKAVDNAGKAEYSTTINVVYNPSLLHVSTFPNPATDVLNVEMKLSSADKINLQIADMAGRTLISRTVQADNNIRRFPVSINQLHANMYVLKITNSNNEIIGIQKFVKQ